MVVVVLAAGCQKGPEASPPLPPPPAAASAPLAASPPSAASSAASAANKLAPATGYPMCGGQTQATAEAARAGAVSAQLAPAFLDQMSACRAEDAAPAELIKHTTDGTINDKGDCVFPNGVSCHYHSGSEFMESGSAKQTPGQGELHCIFPSSDPKSPQVFGAHLSCRDPAQGMAANEPGKHEVKAGASCSAALLSELTHCASSRCCDDGTLTNPIADLVRDAKNDIRPDFRICESTLSIDCNLLANFTAHDANSPALGGIGKPVFVLKHEAHAHEKKVASHTP
jgi:hypothetical protein